MNYFSPCMDEPQLKATFEITVDHPLNTTALGNTRHTADLVEGPNGTLITTKFEITEKMPTSMIALTVFYDSDFKSVSGKSQSGIPIKLWARRHFIDENQADIGLDLTIKIFNALEDLFSKVDKKSLPAKIDVLAIPDYPVN